MSHTQLSILLLLSTGLIFACGEETTEDSDPYGLTESYHDYRSCEEAGDNRASEPPSAMSTPAEMEMMPETEAEPVDNVALQAMLPVSEGAVLQDGLYLMRINLVEVTLVLDFQLEIVGMSSEEGGQYSVMRLRAVDGDNVSEPFGEATEVTIDAQGQYTAAFNDAVLPAAFSPSGSDVLFSLLVTGVNESESTGCGFVTGELTTLDLSLAESTFSIVPWDERTAESPSGCGEDGGGVACERLTPDQCPDLTAGENTITSCGIERKVRIRLPEGHTANGSQYKTIVLFHGLTSTQVDDIEEDTALNKLVDPYNFILMSPYSRRLAIEWDQGRPGDNPDVALFEDLLTCAEAKLGADPERLYAAGDSGGGMFTTFLMTQFTDKLAAAAINSGGTLFTFPEESGRAIPIIYGWGGACDEARGQNFERLGEAALSQLSSDGHFLVACNHDSGHEWKPLFSLWYLEFLFAHTRSGGVESPFASGLPDTFPDYCQLYQGE